MAIISTDVDVCNIALGNIGQPPIQTLVGNLPAQKACKLRYDEARQEAISAAPWNFSTTWGAGVPYETYSPKAPWGYVFRFPTNALAVYEILRADPRETPYGFEVTDSPDNTGKLIHTDQASPVFVFGRDKPNISTWDQEFIQAVGWLLASKIAMPITKSLKIQQEAYKMWLDRKSAAATKSANEGFRDRSQDIASYQAVR